MKHWFEKIKQTLGFKKPPSTQIDFLDLSDDAHTVWWGTFAVDPEQSRYAKIGTLVLCIDHYNDEWKIAHYREGQDKKIEKTITAHLRQGDLILKPVLPDRSLLFTLEQPVFMPANSNITLYLSTPVFIQLALGTPPIPLEEIQIEVLSDTWSGKNTRSGELCYSVPHFASLHLDGLPRDNTHAITPVSVQNDAHNNILLKEIKISSPFLSIFSDAQHNLWTEQVSIRFEEHGHINTLILKGQPQGLNNLVQLSPPRFTVKMGFKNFFIPGTRI